MKKLIFSFVILCASMSLFAQMPQIVSMVSSEKSNSEFMEVYNQAIELNKHRFADLNKIQIGDTVCFPSRTGSGVEYWVADYPMAGVHDCIWNLTGKYLAGQIITVPADTTDNTIEFVAPEPINTNLDLWAWLIIIGLMLLVIAFYLLNRFKPWNNRRNLDRNPVVVGGLSNNPGMAARQVSALNGSRVVKSEKGRLICASPVKVQMNFSDGVKKVLLVSGEEYYKITEDNGTIRYARRACGNLINGSISQLPNGVTFVSSIDENDVWTAEPKETKNQEQPVNEEPQPLEVALHVIDHSAMTGKDVALILEAAGKMTNVPSSISVGDLVVRFYKEKAEDK